MRRYIFAFFAVVITAQGQTVSNISASQVTHSTMQLLFNVTGSYSYYRVRYGTSACSGGSGGTVQTNGTSPAALFSTNMTANLSGLAPNTTYFVCPEVSSNGSTWSSGVQASFTTLALPSPHPALPVAPATFDTSYPNTAGFTTVNTTCANYQNDLNTAVANQLTNGTVLQIPAGSVCLANTSTSASTYYTTPIPPDVKSFQSANIDSTTGKITISNHGFTNNQEVRLATNGCLMQSMGYSDPFCQLRGILKGNPYYAQVVDANNFYLMAAPSGSIIDFSIATVTPNVASNNFVSSVPLQNNYWLQFKSTGSMPAPLTTNTWYQVASSGGTTFSLNGVTLTSAGSGTISAVDLGGSSLTTQYIAGYPRALHPIIVRTSTPDAQFTPAGVRTSPAWQPAMATLKLNTVGGGYWNVIQGFGLLAANIRFVGIEFTHGDNSAEANTSTDPQPWFGLLETGPDTSSIILDRCYLHGLGYPNRLYRAIPTFDGHLNGIVNSYLSNLDYWHATYTGFGLSGTSATQFVIQPGTSHMGVITPTLPSVATVNFSGSGSGTAMIYFDMSGHFTVNFPPGLTPGSCTGTGVSCTVLNTQGASNGSCNQSDAWPKNANGRAAAGEIACLQITNGVITGGQNADAFSSADDTEGSSSFIAGDGPGPWVIANNYLSGSGIIMHFDDSGSDIGSGPMAGTGYSNRADYLVQRNTYNTPFTDMFGGPLSNGLRYGHRQPLEWKGGARIKVDGNIFDGTFTEDTASAVFVDFTPRSGGYTSDVDITNNTFQHGPGGVGLPQPTDSYAPISKPVARIRAKNNLFWDINGWTYHVFASALGWAFVSGYGEEDVILDHNTIYDNRGTEGSFLHSINFPTEGVSITNNFLFDSGSRLFVSENVANCSGLADEALMNCEFISGPGNASFTFSRNVIVPSWSNSSVPSGQLSQSSIQGVFPDYYASNPVLSSSLGGVPQTIGSVNWFGPTNFHLQSSSAFISGGASHGTDGLDVGADMDALEAAQGKVTLTGTSQVTSSGATIAFVAPDSMGCTVDYSSTDPTVLTSFTRVANAGGARVQNVALSGLTTKTVYYYRVNCAVMQPTGQFRTR